MFALGRGGAEQSGPACPARIVMKGIGCAHLIVVRDSVVQMESRFKIFAYRFIVGHLTNRSYYPSTGIHFLPGSDGQKYLTDLQTRLILL